MKLLQSPIAYNKATAGEKRKNSKQTGNSSSETGGRI